MKRLRNWLHYLVPLAVLVLALGVRVLVPAVEEVQLKIFDTFQRIKPRTYEPTPVKFVDLDDESLERIGQWPWPRTYVAGMTARLANMGAAAIVFDIVFAEPDRTSPDNVLPLWPATPELEALRGAADKLPDHDRVLGEVFAQANVVTGFVLTNTGSDRLPVTKGNLRLCGRRPQAVRARLSWRHRQPAAPAGGRERQRQLQSRAGDRRHRAAGAAPVHHR